VIIIVYINSEGRINENCYLIDGMLMGLPKFLSIYIIENNGMRLMIDAGEALKARKIVRKLKDFGLYPINKLVVTHSHWDHAQGITKLKQIMKDTEIEVLASENGVKHLKNPTIMSEPYGYNVDPLEDVTPLKEGDIIDLNGLELEIINFYGHTMDSIGIFDRKNKDIKVGGAILNRLDQDAFFVPIMPPDFHEKELLKSFEKLRNMKNELNSISLAHFGVWKDDDFERILNEMEELYYKVKNSIIEWHKKDPSVDIIADKYVEKFMPNSKFWNAQVMKVIIEWAIAGLKMSGELKQ
jgi:glyoxylase-like metal-dependent hydrolase (beta-lactamase superfamily II)